MLRIEGVYSLQQLSNPKLMKKTIICKKKVWNNCKFSLRNKEVD